jgi:hypothetical protein
MMRNLFFIGVLLPLSSNILASTLAVDNVQLGDVDSLSRSGNILISSYVYVVSDSSLTLEPVVIYPSRPCNVKLLSETT